MAIDKSTMNKGQVVKLNALRKSLGNDLADGVFAKWLKRQTSAKSIDKPDPIAARIVAALAGLEKDAEFRLGNQGYTVKRSRGKGATGFIAAKNIK